ncbi:hypothetical protein PP175_29675 (plasmid) [Aneurinibacillus sp. Ricciae_BoGa-3]|uniref:hypothetical protein n=1 Tax=Aneurinibacillus sp. Ricciae_BoGa-3 TaxID=3022697 RepID=UPI00233FD69F|nr:hypothetical protein [Aneurinibacillus sp. Ricciae_BoGa-3]WCK57362.1 hypothetical protein PP175_29675 [Aneurinibacillus sp. Ricciae_BoGa-3]
MDTPTDNPTDNLHLKCYKCLRKMWTNVEDTHLEKDLNYFEQKNKYQISFTPVNKKFVEQFVNKSGMEALDTLMNKILKKHAKHIKKKK